MIGLTLEKTGDNDGPLDDKNVQSKDINILYQGLQSLAAILLEKEKIKLFYAYSAAQISFSFFSLGFRTVLSQTEPEEATCYQHVRPGKVIQHTSVITKHFKTVQRFFLLLLFFPSLIATFVILSTN